MRYCIIIEFSEVSNSKKVIHEYDVYLQMFQLCVLDKTSKFFLNGNGFSLGRIQNGPGSLLQRIGLACGVPDLNPTMLR